jgi:hypothetical protein
MTVSYSYRSYYVADMNRWKLCDGYKSLKAVSSHIAQGELVRDWTLNIMLFSY